MATKTTKGSFKFESTECSRCGGSGHYSYCQMYGTTCFRCSGQKTTLTKRGAAAQEYFRRLCSKTASEIQVGDKILYQGFTAGSYTQPSAWCTVQKVDGGTIETDKCLFQASPDTVYRVAQSAADKTAKLAWAIEYQAGLTQAGNPSKGFAPRTIRLKQDTEVNHIYEADLKTTLPVGTEVRYYLQNINGQVHHVILAVYQGRIWTAAKVC